MNKKMEKSFGLKNWIINEYCKVMSLNIVSYTFEIRQIWELFGNWRANKHGAY
jgi:hypothetical protein